MNDDPFFCINCGKEAYTNEKLKIFERYCIDCIGKLEGIVRTKEDEK